MGILYTFQYSALAPDVRELVRTSPVTESFTGSVSGVVTDITTAQQILEVKDVPAGVLEAILDVIPGAPLAQIRALAARSSECRSRGEYYDLLRKEKALTEARDE